MGLISNGTTIFDNGSMASGFGSSLKFISKATASASASIEFTSGIDSTYKEYVFYFVNMHPSSARVNFQFNLSTDNGSNYNVTKTTTYFNAYHQEDDGATSLGYEGGEDLAQSTAYQNFTRNLEANNDDSCSGYLQLFNPSSTTFVKHFISTLNWSYNEPTPDPYSINAYVAGYGNTTSAIDAVKFQMSSGNIDSGEIILFGVS